MAAITSAQLRSIAEQLAKQYSDIRFEEAGVARWSSEEMTVFYRPVNQARDLYDLFHELGHAIAGHTSYQQDIELLAMEREAWSEASDIARTYHVTIELSYVEQSLDSYREWLHKRSRCPACDGSGIQDTSGSFTCPLCHTKWRANDARQCGLKRTLQK